MAEIRVGIISPGEMGAAVGASLVRSGRAVLTVLDARSARTRQRAELAGIEAVDDIGVLVREASVIISIVPPAAALDVAAGLAAAIRMSGTSPLVVEANAVSPEHAEEMAALVWGAGGRFVDANLIGGPPELGRPPTRLYLSGSEAGLACAVLATSELQAVVLDGPRMAASSLKMAYATWTKGSAALLLAARSLAHALGVEGALLAEWEISQPDLIARCGAAAQSAGNAWRFVTEMEEIRDSHESSGLPDGFGEAAAEIYRRLTGFRNAAEPPLDEVIGVLVDRQGRHPG